MAFDDKTPNPVDVHVGARIRLRRKLLGMSQDQLAQPLNLTFQQVQKYERGANRVSASKLFEIGQVLKVPVFYFFEDYSQGNGGEDDADFAPSSSERNVSAFLQSHEGVELAQTFPKIVGSKKRRRILDLVRALSEDADL